VKGRPPAPFESLLVEAGRLLASSLELEETLRTVARLAVPELADWAAVDVFTADGTLEQLSSGHADPAKDELLLTLRHRWREQPGGATPSGALSVLADGEPAIFEPLRGDALPPMTAQERRLWEELGPVSWLIVPMRVGADAVGVMTFLSTDPTHVYDDGDVPVAMELADRCAQAVRNAQLYDEAESSRALLDTILATAPVGLCLLDKDLRFLLVNERMAAMNQVPLADHLGRPLGEVLTGDAGETAGVIRRVFETGRPITDAELVDEDRAFLASYAPVYVDDRVLGVICAVVETTERHHAQEAVGRLLDRTARLQSVSERLAGALTEQEVAEVIVRVGMEATGASCGVLGLRDADRGLRIEHRFGMAGGAPGHLPLDAPAPMPRAAREVRSVLLRSHAEWLERFPQVPPRGDFEGFAAVPLVYEGRANGVMGLGFPDVREYDAGDIETLEAVARQGAQALERARLYEERAYVARTLQAGLLPRRLPDIPGLDVAVRYRPLGDGSEVGGDFYDVFALEDPCFFVAVGDICGKGTAAAVLTGVVRSTIRALALRESDPAAILAGVNEALRREASPQALASAACATLRPDGAGFAFELSAGGHPPAMVLRAGGTTERIDVPGPLLGVLVDPPLRARDVALGPGDLLLLYTDGIIDAHRQGSEPFGEDRLEAALAAAAGGDAASVIAAIDADVRAYAPGAPRDDKALLALRVG
jgi:serine phosphatase RsbU (regulator of sigma subunit)/PAS domain-containing protein